MRRVALVLVALVVVLGGLIALRLWTQARALAAPSGGSGEIEGTTVDLSSRVGARILELGVREGEAVKAGALVVRLDCADPEAQLAEAQARLAAAKAQAAAASAQLTASERNRVAARAGEEAARAQAEALAAQRDAAERQARRLAALPQDVPASSIDQTQRERDRARAPDPGRPGPGVGQRRAGGGGHLRDPRRARPGRGGARPGAAAEAAVARARILGGECELRAPRDAEIETLPHEAGELVSPGAVLARLVDLSEVKATFYLPNAEVGAVKPGATAMVRGRRLPGRAVRGHGPHLALEAEFTPRNIQTRTDRDRLVYPVEVDVANPDGTLRAGMPVQVTLPGTGR